MRTLVALALTFLLGPAPAWAHGAAAHTEPLWTLDPWILVPLFVSGVLYFTGTAALWRRAGWGRGIKPWRVGAYGLGWLLLAGALVSPLHGLGEHLFTAHMIEHEIIMALAAPLIAVARPLAACLWALPKSLRHVLGEVMRTPALAALWQNIARPQSAALIHGVAIWFWHAPMMFEMSVTSIAVHRLQHLSFFASALLFWWSLIRHSTYGMAALQLFLTMLHTSVLGALIALAPRVLYLTQTADALRWGLTPLEDQQLAGVVMWVPAGTVYAGAVLACVALWIGQSGQRAQQWQREGHVS
jgi:putative membrane protein